VAAERALVAGGVGRRARREVVDQVAASVFLQAWLDARRQRAARQRSER
jgi:RNase H-fold protein (predicted Holliday junction resolvase)